jgi:hypothetical protein
MVLSDDEVPTVQFSELFDHDENDQSINEIERDDITDNEKLNKCEVSPLVTKTPLPRRLNFDSDSDSLTNDFPVSPVTTGAKREAVFSPVLINQKRLKVFHQLKGSVLGETFTHDGSPLTNREIIIKNNLESEFGDIITPSIEQHSVELENSSLEWYLMEGDSFLECRLCFNNKIDDGSYQAMVFNTTLSNDMPVFEFGKIVHHDEIAEFEPISERINIQNDRGTPFLFLKNEYRPKVIIL